jgi:hypothetical protein
MPKTTIKPEPLTREGILACFDSPNAIIEAMADETLYIYRELQTAKGQRRDKVSRRLLDALKLLNQACNKEESVEESPLRAYLKSIA